MVKNPSFKMGKSHRESFNKEMMTQPGPATYDTTNESTSAITKRNSPRAFIGDSGRNVLNKTTTHFPGPGNYMPFRGLGNELQNY